MNILTPAASTLIKIVSCPVFDSMLRGMKLGENRGGVQTMIEPKCDSPSLAPPAVEILNEYDSEWLIYVRREFGRLFYHHSINEGVHAVCQITEEELADLKMGRRDIRSLFDDRPAWTLTEKVWAVDDNLLPERGVNLYREEDE